MNVYLLPYQKGSAGAKNLADALDIKRIKTENSRFVPGNNKLVLNWGNCRTQIRQPMWLNDPARVSAATNKYDALCIMADAGVPCIEFSSDPSQALSWVDSDSIVICRRKLRGHSGDGIVVAENRAQVCSAHLYTRYFKAKDEYRIHVVDGKVIDVQQKRKRQDVPNKQVNYKVRSHANGFNFCREGIDLPECCATAAVDACAALQLDFGAVDLRYNAKSKECAVLEVNTAPGLEGTTIEVYAAAFAELFQSFGVQH